MLPSEVGRWVSRIFRDKPPMKISQHSRLPRLLPLREGSYKWSGGKSVTVFDSTIVAVETDEGVTGFGEVCPLGPVLPAGLCRRCARGHRRAGAAPARRRPAPARPAQPPHGRGIARPRLRQVGHRHGLLGHPRQGNRPTGVRAPGRPLRRRLRALPRHLAGSTRSDGARASPNIARRAIAAFSSRSAATRSTTSSAFAPSLPSCKPATPWSPTPTPAG